MREAILLLLGFRLGVSWTEMCSSTSAAAAAGEKKTRSILKSLSRNVR